tara:strand:- start:60 stop:500 length:441 start_codon:yes stop_codon:yes gene_type:complete
MVHRIQNRNPGYSDFSTMNSSLSSNFKNNTTNHISDGATALKSEVDTLKDDIEEKEIDNSININSDIGAAETLVNDQDDSLILKNEIEEFKKDSNGLENFGIEENTLELFENDASEENSGKIQNAENDETEEDEFEIPAFLRRQKN